MYCKKQNFNKMDERKKILVIDDDTWMQRYITNALESVGYKVYVASDAVRGLNSAITIIPDLILLDIIMPVITGDMLVYILKRLDLTENIPVLILSGNLDAGIIAKTYKTGAKGFITKPFTRELLINKVNEIFINTESAPEPAPESAITDDQIEDIAEIENAEA